MTINELLKRFNISKASVGRELGYVTYAGIYKALNNPRQQPLIKSYLKEKILRENGIDINILLDSLN